MKPEEKQAFEKRLTHYERALENLKAEFEKAKANQEPPPAPFKLGDRVVYIGDSRPGLKTRVGMVSRIDETDVPFRVAIPGGFYWTSRQNIRAATPTEIAKADFGLEVGDWVKLPGGEIKQIEDFVFQDGILRATGSGAYPHGWFCWDASELFKVPASEPKLEPEEPAPKFKPGTAWVRVNIVTGELTPHGNVESLCHQNGIGEFHSWFKPEDVIQGDPVFLGEPGEGIKEGSRVMQERTAAREITPNADGNIEVDRDRSGRIDASSWAKKSTLRRILEAK